jgi:hypothetical protein
MRDKWWNKWVLIFSLGLVLSCGDIPTCLDIETNLVKIKFIDSEGNAKDIFLTKLSAIGNEDGFPEYDGDTLSSISLPLNPGALTTTFIFEQTSGTIDTIGLSYSVVASLISPECGLDATFSDMDTTFATFEKLIILDLNIHEDIITNFEITL